MNTEKIRVGITMGDPSGIGPAVIAKALPKLAGIADFVVIGDKWVFDKIKIPKLKIETVAKPQRCHCEEDEGRRSNLKTGLLRPFGARNDALRGLFQRSQIQKFEFIDLNNVKHKNFSFGKIRAEYGKASIEYLDKAIRLLKKGALDCLVTCPISKEAINLAGFHYSGHTEYLAKNTHTEEPVMLLLNKDLKISLVTRHLPLHKVAAQINKERICRVVNLTHNSLKVFFGIQNPGIVVCALNPHASDNGTIGDEENRVIRPAIEKLKKDFNISAAGPYPADTAIYLAGKKKYDCVIAMYHDQALIPLKISGNNTGVNMTLGLPFVRTSPLHGTAFDIAGNPALADADSLIAASRLAVKCAQKRKNP